MPNDSRDEPQAEDRESDGMAALQMAQAHLSTLITATDALDSKATFLIAVNVALFGVFFGVIASAESPDWSAVAAPAVISLLVLAVGWWTVRPREHEQFVRPSDLLRHRLGGYTDRAMAWSYVESIRRAGESVSDVIDKKAVAVQRLAVLSVLNFAAIAVSTVIWVA